MGRYGPTLNASLVALYDFPRDPDPFCFCPARGFNISLRTDAQTIHHTVLQRVYHETYPDDCQFSVYICKLMFSEIQE